MTNTNQGRLQHGWPFYIHHFRLYQDGFNQQIPGWYVLCYWSVCSSNLLDSVLQKVVGCCPCYKPSHRLSTRECTHDNRIGIHFSRCYKTEFINAEAESCVLFLDPVGLITNPHYLLSLTPWVILVTTSARSASLKDLREKRPHQSLTKPSFIHDGCR